MRKIFKSVFCCLVITVFAWCIGLITDRNTLNNDLIRFHVVANSDSQEDQAVKLKVRDAITNSIKADMEKIGDVEDALTYLNENIPKLQNIANMVLKSVGMEPDAVVSLCKEAFDTRYYDTFTLPAGVYNALRVTLGSGQGKNWWCVVFPTLCQPTTVSEFEQQAVAAGLNQELTDTLVKEDNYEVRFFLLDAMGKLENMFIEE